MPPETPELLGRAVERYLTRELARQRGKYKKLNLELIPRHPGLLAGHDNDIELMVRLSATDFEEQSGTDRTPLNLGVVIDRSGSMSGQPLEEAKTKRVLYPRSIISIRLHIHRVIRCFDQH